MNMNLQATAVLAILALTTACQQDARLTSLEQRVSRLEQSARQFEAGRDKNAADESARRAKLESCVGEANAAYDRNIVSNGTKGRNGNYSVPVTVASEMNKLKQSKIEECKLLYSK